MRDWRLQDIRIILGGQWLDSPPTGSGYVCGVSTDTRTVKPGELFVALKGERHDGHLHLHAAREAGASCAVIERGAQVHQPGMPCMVVEDSLRAYGELARMHRRSLNSTHVVAVAGSNGKTTTRTMIAAVLALAGKTSQNEANENNLVGVPKTLLALMPDVRHAVIEIGTNVPGEIARLTEIVEPVTGVLTNISEEHLEGLGSIEGVLEEEAALLRGLPREGMAIFNVDDLMSVRARRYAGCESVGFGLDQRALIRATDVKLSLTHTEFRLNGGERFTLAIPGAHNVSNALAAIAVGWTAGIEAAAMSAALAAVKPVKMRMQVLDAGGVTVIHDCYNANPASMKAALRSLRAAESGRRIACLGDMLEMGEHATAAHEELLAAIVAARLDLLVLVGPHMGALQPLVEKAAVPHVCYASSAEAAGFVAQQVRLSDNLLVKGSRGIAMEKISDAVMAARTGQHLLKAA